MIIEENHKAYLKCKILIYSENLFRTGRLMGTPTEVQG